MPNKNVEDKYKKHNLKDHILELPDVYIGSIEETKVKIYILDDANNMIEKEISYIPGLFKIFDEIIVNCIDHSSRLKVEEENGKENVKHVKNIKVIVNKETGWIEITNDGNGIDVERHSQYNNVWIPELIFGELLTSTNYDKGEEKLIGGKFGYGSKLVSIFSKEFKIETIDHYRKKLYTQEFHNNMSIKDEPVIKACARIPYTKISFLPDYERFGLKGLTEDMFYLFKRRVYDACATTMKDVSIYFNGVKLPVKDFEKYADLFLGSKTDQPRAYESPNERWEVVAALNNNNGFEQISFVNGINTLRGGKHLDYITNAITKNLCDMVQNKKKKIIKPQHIKDNLFVFVKSTIVNPSFDSQTKETLTTQVAKFGSKCELSDKFYDKLYKSGIVERALNLSSEADTKKLTKTDGKKISKIIVPKLDDANLAGTKDSSECTLILTEGDSAKTMAIAGLSVVGRDKYGVFPLRGKIMNVKDATPQKISDNIEITALKKILGLEQNKKYSDISSLRYGKIMIMTDQDHDGSHIKGLLFNVFQTLWPTLYKINGFMTSMLTPIIKATNGRGEIMSFYNMSDYEKWNETKQGAWKIKYYKGLGTSKEDEAKEYFRNIKKVTYVHTEESDQSIDLAFNKKRADDRKEWLANYNKTNVLDYSIPDVEYETFINKDLIHFSNRDLERSINHICDGLKESTRKILFACMKRKLYTNEIKVAQLSGYVSEVTAYHHGETSLQQAIIGMAQIFVGTNNINLLVPNGQFGSRIHAGNDASSPRYIYTLLSQLTKKLFKEEDNQVLNYLEEEGQDIEPEYYIPVIPLILVNGGIGIGTGYSTNIPQHNPEDIINICLDICKSIDVKILEEDDLSKAFEIMKEKEIRPITPYYLGFKGEIYKNDKSNGFVSKGIYKWINKTTVEISELPIGTWTEDYKEYLESLILNNHSHFRTFESHYTTKNVKFILNFIAGYDETKFETEFKMTSTKNLSLNNLHLYSAEGNIKKYENHCDIIKEWSKIRLIKYYERKKNQLKEKEHQFKILSTKIRFIIDVIENRVHIMNKKYEDIEKQLDDLSYDRDEENNTYDYLLKMPISQLTLERKEVLEKQVETLKSELETLRNTSILDIWKQELDELMVEWKSHRKLIEEEHENDKNGGQASSTKKRTTKK